MGRRRCCCSPSGLCGTYTVRGCRASPSYGGYNPGAGIVVRIRASSGGALVASGVTDASGVATICVPTSGTRWVEVDAIPSLGYGAYGLLHATGVVARNVDLTAASGRCCVTPGTLGCASPYITTTSLWYTDATGTYPGSTGVTCRGVNVLVDIPVANAMFCDSGPGGTGLYSLGPGTTRVRLQTANVGGTNGVLRTWNEWHVPGVGIGYASSTASPACTTPVSATVVQGRMEGAFADADCLHYYSVAPMSQVAGSLSDPVGGDVVASE